MDFYTIQCLKPTLYLITWHRTSNGLGTDNAYLDALKDILQQAEAPVYFISDLRHGRLVNMGSIKRLGKLTEHPMWGGSTAFTNNPVSRLHVSNFQRYTGNNLDHNPLLETPEEAIGFLESLQAGLTTDMDWESIIKKD